MSAEDHKQALAHGFRLGPYRVVRVLGVGGFGVTYLCEHEGLGVQVAVKEYLPNEIAVRDGLAVHPKSAGDREGFEWGLSRFLDEARTLARFEHPNVVRVRDSFEANNTAYIVMDYEDGAPLDALLRRHGTLTETQLKRVLLPVINGLRQVHAAGFLHRDIKPSNIFVRRSDESPVLLDFGSARQALGRRSRSVTAIASAGYSPPEQYERDGPQGPWTDIYALSALCYRAITGDAPMEVPRRQNQLMREQSDPLPKLAERSAPSYSDAFLEAVDWGLRLIETKRPQSLDEWLPRLERATTVRPTQPQQPITVPRDSELRSGNQPTSPHFTIEQVSERQTEQAGRDETGDLIVGQMGLAESSSHAGDGGKAASLTASRDRAKAALVLAWLLLLPIGFGIAWMAARQDTSQTVISVREAAEQAEAQYKLGVRYAQGDGVPKDAGQAAIWLRRAAERGHVDAQFYLGVMYTNGEGVPEDDGQAVSWYRKAAEQGHADAQLYLGVRYDTGRGVPEDAGQAVSWYRKAAEQGQAEAQINLGFFYYDGRGGVPKDAGQAAVWFRRAAEHGDVRAQYNLGLLYYDGNGVPKDAKQAVVWYRKAAEQDFPEAQYNLGVIYANGEGVPKDDRQAVSWYRKAAERGFAEAQYNLGVMYGMGRGVAEDNGRAVAWYRKAAEQGHAGAQYNLGVMYANGEGVAEDDRQAVSWYRKAAEQDFPEAQYNLGVIYANGEGVPKDDRQAASWYRKAAEQGYAEAQLSLGLLYYDGRGGVPKDVSQAAVWFHKAAEQGDTIGQYILGVLYATGAGVPLDLIQSYAWLNLAAAGGHESAEDIRTTLQEDMTHSQIIEAQRLGRELAG